MPESAPSLVALRAGVALGSCLVLLSGCAVGYAETDQAGSVAQVQMVDDDGLNGVVLPEPYSTPGTLLETTDGAAYSLARDARDPLTLVFFGYTHCPDICQLVMADIASALTRLSPEERSQVGMDFVTTDPARDDAGTLRDYLGRFDPAFTGLRGPLPQIVAAGTALGVPVARGKKLPSGGYEVDHGTQVIGLRPDGTAPVIWTQTTSPSQMAEDISLILADGVPHLDESAQATP